MKIVNRMKRRTNLSRTFEKSSELTPWKLHRMRSFHPEQLSVLKIKVPYTTSCDTKFNPRKDKCPNVVKTENRTFSHDKYTPSHAVNDMVLNTIVLKCARRLY